MLLISDYDFQISISARNKNVLVFSSGSIEKWLNGLFLAPFIGCVILNSHQLHDCIKIDIFVKASMTMLELHKAKKNNRVVALLLLATLTEG